MRPADLGHVRWFGCAHLLVGAVLLLLTEWPGGLPHVVERAGFALAFYGFGILAAVRLVAREHS